MDNSVTAATLDRRQLLERTLSALGLSLALPGLDCPWADRRGPRRPTSLITLSLAAGYRHPSQFTGDDIEFSAGVNRFSTLAEVLDYRADPVSSEDVMAAVREAEASVVA